MGKLTRFALLAMAFSVLAIGLSFFTNNPVHATAHVEKGTAVQPAPIVIKVQDVDSPARNPFAVSATCTSSNDTGCAANPVFPSTTATGGAVKTVVIDFMSAVCTGLATGITQDNFNFGYLLSTQPNEIFFPAVVDASGTGRMGLQTTIYADPGSTAAFTTPGINSGCSVSVTGHLIPQ